HSAVRRALEPFPTRRSSDLASEVDRYCSWAGQACGYKVGHSEIVRQRGLAQKALGAKYDLRDFNDVVVKGGNVPLDVLAQNVDRSEEHTSELQSRENLVRRR